MGADIRCVNKQLRNVFHMAVESGSVGVLQRMVHEGRTQHCIRELINSRDRYLGRERCFLVRGRDQGAAAFHYIECHRWLISAFSDTTKAGGTVDVAHFGVPIVSGWGISPSPQDVERVDHHYDVNKVDARTPEDLTPLNLLALSWTATKPTKMAEILVQALVSEGLSLDISDCFGLTPMHMAAMRGNMDMVRLLLRNNVNYGLKSLQDHQAIEVAELNNHVSVVNYIKSHDVINGESLRVCTSRANSPKDLSNKYSTITNTLTWKRQLTSIFWTSTCKNACQFTCTCSLPLFNTYTARLPHWNNMFYAHKCQKHMYKCIYIYIICIVYIRRYVSVCRYPHINTRYVFVYMITSFHMFLFYRQGFVRDLKAVNDAFETQQLATLQESGASIEKHIIETSKLNTQRTHDVMITPWLRQNDVATSFGVMMTLSLRPMSTGS